MSGGINNPKITYSGYVKMWQGSNKISILSVSVGLQVSTNYSSEKQTKGNQSQTDELICVCFRILEIILRHGMWVF